MSDPGAREPSLSSLEAMEMNAPEPIAPVTVPDHHFLYQTLGLGLVLSPRLSVEGLGLDSSVDAEEYVIKLMISNCSEASEDLKKFWAQSHPAGTKMSE